MDSRTDKTVAIGLPIREAGRVSVGLDLHDVVTDLLRCRGEVQAREAQQSQDQGCPGR